jgi:hypothetical protein
MPEIVFSAKASENTYSFAVRNPPDAIAKARNRGPGGGQTTGACSIVTLREKKAAKFDVMWVFSTYLFSNCQSLRLSGDRDHHCLIEVTPDCNVCSSSVRSLPSLEGKLHLANPILMLSDDAAALRERA